MRWAEHVARMGERRCAYRILWGNLKERGLGLDARIVLKLSSSYSMRGREVD
jgi:hypothetical protein